MMVFALLGALYTGLMPALLAGLLVYHFVEFGGWALEKIGVRRLFGKIFLAIFLIVIIVAVVTGGISALRSQILYGPESFAMLMKRVADVVDTAKSHLPIWAHGYLPANIEEWQVLIAGWLRENAGSFGTIGQEAGHALVHLLFGMIIGGLVAIDPGFQKAGGGPLGREISARLHFLSDAFKRIVFSQVRISALNTFLTAIFLAVFLPLMGHPMPFTKTLIALTFVVGLLPIVGNLISNTVIFLVGLSISPWLAIGSLLYLVVIHKIEYFFNAHIIGTRIGSRAWEILLAMLVMEAVFGIAGLVAAPIYYAYIKDELRVKRLI